MSIAKETIKGTIKNIINASYLDIEDENKNIIPCYITKKLKGKKEFSEGAKKIVKGWFKEFNQKKYFCVHEVEEQEKKWSSEEIKRAIDFVNTGNGWAGNLGYINEIVHTIFNKGCIYLEDDHSDGSLLVEVVDERITKENVKKSFTLNVVDEHWSLGFLVPYGSLDKPKPVFKTPQIFEALNGINLMSKKWGCLAEGKVKIEILQVAFRMPWLFKTGDYVNFSIDKKEDEEKHYEHEYHSSFTYSQQLKISIEELKKVLEKKGTYKSGIDFFPHDVFEWKTRLAPYITERDYLNTSGKVRKIRLTIRK